MFTAPKTKKAHTLTLRGNANSAPFFGFCLKVFRLEGRTSSPPQRVNCMTPMEVMRRVSFLRTQRRTASLEIEPVVSNLSITSPTLYLPL